MKPFENFGVIFDMDGVLVDSTEAHYEAWRLTGEWKSKPYSRPFFDRTFGMHNRQSIALWLGRDVPEEERKEISTYKEKLYRQIAKETLKPIPGAVALVHLLHANGFHLAVGSSGPSENVRLSLEVLGLDREFDAISCGDEVMQGKPDPAVFLNAARKLGIPPPRCAVVEDAPAGIEAAHRGMMTAVAIPTSRTREDLHAADLIVDSLTELTPQRIVQLIGSSRDSVEKS